VFAEEGPFWSWRKAQRARRGVLHFLGRSCLDRMVRRMLLVVEEPEIGFDELPCVRPRIEIRVYGVRGIRDASICQFEPYERID